MLFTAVGLCFSVTIVVEFAIMVGGVSEMTLREKQAKFTWMLSLLFEQFQKNNDPFVILELYRSLATQKAYVARGVSKTLNSKHLDGLAIDLAFLKDIQDDGKVNYPAEMYKPYGIFWEQLGGRWGGRFGDNPTTEKIEGWDLGHFEYKER